MISRVLFVVLCAVLAAAAAEPVGLLSIVSGNVQLLRAGQKAPVAARTADLVFAGDRVSTGRNSEASFLFCPQTRAAKITADSDVVFEAAGVTVRKGKLADERKVPSCRLPANIALAAATQQQSGMVRLRGANLMLRSPARTSVADLQPLFRWSPVDNAKVYDVKLMDREERVLWRQTVPMTEVQYPADARPLEWGQKYWWRVAARDGEDTLTEAGSFFQILPADQAEHVRTSQANLRKMLEDSPGDNGPRFLLAFLYDENGMLDEAARMYGELSDRMGPQEWVQGRLIELMNKLGWDKVDRISRP